MQVTTCAATVLLAPRLRKCMRCGNAYIDDIYIESWLPDPHKQKKNVERKNSENKRNNSILRFYWFLSKFFLSPKMMMLLPASALSRVIRSSPSRQESYPFPRRAFRGRLTTIQGISKILKVPDKVHTAAALRHPCWSWFVLPRIRARIRLHERHARSASCVQVT